MDGAHARDLAEHGAVDRPDAERKPFAERALLGRFRRPCVSDARRLDAAVSAPFMMKGLQAPPDRMLAVR